MRSYSFILLAVAIVAGAITFSGMGTNVANVAKGVYFVFMLLVAASILIEPEDVATIRRSSGAPQRGPRAARPTVDQPLDRY